ncbi:hypothetical protein PGUG_03170 [Meyerozyma guilliermondii ATCC 6260]|uniref:Uncharacterized protein n=1 Tax=Meyerozyma guilliermondii (strain ATCC 6260 / CBS 566 / DSM 6381 / JCM 1539 / NBRC 10279 / NRRL Y-324) TaxID=294746 RepID=A5DIR9_PICGU|nr:uncharacterized protein PGUG_03170 [Meyerozyma guilliermondii ATCC 6260]EDK39071.2 hypothetical protein PGUG_03170 [Meyerozyma guilliermondii ATCC 6260]
MARVQQLRSSQQLFRKQFCSLFDSNLNSHIHFSSRKSSKSLISVVKRKKCFVVPSSGFVTSGISLETFAGEKFEFEKKKNFVMDAVVQREQVAQGFSRHQILHFGEFYFVIFGDSSTYLTSQSTDSKWSFFQIEETVDTLPSRPPTASIDLRKLNRIV